jgi:hypothetical protein
MDGYRRDDGLWEVEARLVDRKDRDFELSFRGRLPPGEPVHDMFLRVVVDERRVIRGIEARMGASPFPSCPGATEAFQELAGLRIGPGWLKEARRLVGGVAGCTHLFEMLGPIATTVYQTMVPLTEKERIADAGRPPAILDSCHGWRRGGEAVERLLPEWFRPAED